MSSLLAFTIGAGMASALLYEASIALDDYATASNPRRYISKGIAPARGPASLNLSVSR